MFKKGLAILVAGTMMVSSASVAMAGESDSSAVNSDIESIASVAEDVSDNLVDFYYLVEAIVTAVEEEAAKVDLAKMEEALGTEFSEDGTVFTILEAILNDVDSRIKESGMDEEESLNQALEALASLGEVEVDEEELDAMINDAILGIIAGAVDRKLDEHTKPNDAEIANTVASFVFDALEENELVVEAVEATDSSLFEMLENSSKELEAYVNEDGTMEVLEDIPEEPFENFEAEVEKVMDYINEQEGPKQAALDLLELVDKVVDEIHLSLHGHTYEELEG